MEIIYGGLWWEYRAMPTKPNSVRYDIEIFN